MEKLSVIIITLNEEKNIRRCLESVREIADEIIVVDSLSTDSTETICAEYGVRFVKQKWLGFSAQKNFANDLASHDWIFSIDADEELSPQLKESIKQIKNNGLSGIYELSRLTFYCGKWIRHCGWYPDAKLRIWNRKDGKWEGNIHEKLIFTKDLQAVRLKGDLYHYSYSDISDHIRIANKYTSLIAEQYYEKGKKASKFKLFWSPKFAFFHDYILRLGFLDGRQGLTICKIAAFSTYLKYIKLWEIQQRQQH